MWQKTGQILRRIWKKSGSVEPVKPAFSKSGAMMMFYLHFAKLDLLSIKHGSFLLYFFVILCHSWIILVIFYELERTTTFENINIELVPKLKPFSPYRNFAAISFSCWSPWGFPLTIECFTYMQSRVGKIYCYVNPVLLRIQIWRYN